MESLKKARALRSQQSLAAEAAEAEAARAEAAREAKLAALRDGEEKSLTSQEREEEKALENVVALFLDIKKKRAAAAAQSTEAAAASPGTPEKATEGAIVSALERPSSDDARDPSGPSIPAVTNNDVFLSDELVVSGTTTDATDASEMSSSVTRPTTTTETRWLPKGNVATLVLDADDLAFAFRANEPLLPARVPQPRVGL